MRILLYEWNSYYQYDIKLIMKEEHVDVTEFAWKFTDKNRDEKFEKWFSENVNKDNYDALFSVNFWPMLSKCAQKIALRYVAWCYDNPLNVINAEETLGNEVNSVFFFDMIQTQKYLNAGIDTVHYLPLAVNVSRLSKLSITGADHAKFDSEIAFVGRLYESKINEIKALMDDYSKGYSEALIAVQQNLYGYYLFDEFVNEELVSRINGHIKKEHPETNFVLLPDALRFAMASEVTRSERLLLLALLGRRYDTKVYSYHTSEILRDVKMCPPVDYMEEMPKVFACSKINLNPSLKCIQSGIPLRALDIMGAGGFLLSNYQMELAELFEAEKEMTMYESMEDALEKTEFYLKNEDLRRAVAQAGKKKVWEDFSMKERLKQIFEISKIF